MTAALVADYVAQVVDRTIELAEIPGPTGAESERATRIAEWWMADRLAEVRIDEVGNVWAHPGEPGPRHSRFGSGDPEVPHSVVVLCAHMDTVFAADVDHRVRLEGDRLHGPGVGDNTVAVAALSAIGSLLKEQGLADRVRLLATVGEEGLGNLIGINWALDHGLEKVGAVVALEGNYLGRIGTIGIGSVRSRVHVVGPGGHSWEAPKAPSAVHQAAHLIAALDAVPVVAGRRTVNVGTVAGGEAINARSRAATFSVELRADESGRLDTLVGECDDVLRAPMPDGVTVAVEVIGRRPAGRIVPEHPLVLAAVTALERNGVAPRQVASSTDANAAHARGIPGLALGITTGAGEHTVDEWIDLGPIATGLECLVATIGLCERESGND